MIQLVILNQSDAEVWSTNTNSNADLKYSLKIDNSGLLELKDNLKDLIWSFPYVLNVCLKNHYLNIQ